MMTVDKQKLSFLSFETAEGMLSRLDYMLLQPKNIVCLGSDSAEDAKLLRERFKNAEVIAFGEKAILPSLSQSVDLIFANLFLPWCSDLNIIFKEWRRMLRPEGVIIFSSLGPDTLMEVHSRVANFILPNLIDMHIIGDELTHARFAGPVLEVEHLTVTYREIHTLLKELKATSFLAEDLLEIKLEPNLEGNFSLTYEVIYGHAFGPNVMVDHIADEMGVVKIPLSHLRRR